MNRINKVLKKKKNILSIYFTAGYPNINDTEEIITKLSECDVDMIEIGLPFSDPLADGPTIQESSTIALNNGMNSIKLFKQLKDIRKKTNIPLIIMGYFNPILQFGVEEFCKNCQTVGIDGLIIPDLPVEVYEENYKHVFNKHSLLNMFLVTPQGLQVAEQIDWGEAAEILPVVSAKMLEPNVTFMGADNVAYSANDGAVDPSQATKKLLSAAQANGAKVIYPCKLNSIAKTLDGEFADTTCGSIPFDQIVLAVGAPSSKQIFFGYKSRL